ncbi:MAG: hypothetical protein AABY22_31260, partial [Nanoarchaeota archaeon]
LIRNKGGTQNYGFHTNWNSNPSASNVILENNKLDFSLLNQVDQSVKRIDNLSFSAEKLTTIPNSVL